MIREAAKRGAVTHGGISTRALATLVGAVSMSLRAVGCGSQGSSATASARTVDVLAVGLQPAAASTRNAPTRSSKRNPGINVKHRPVRLGRLLDQAHRRLHRRHRSRRLHRPHLEVRAVRRPERLAPLDELPPTRAIRDSDYQHGLAASWTGQDGHRYGAPKDWDTVAMFYNKSWRRPRGSPPRRSTASPGTRPTAAPSRRPSPSSPSTARGAGATSPASTRVTSRRTAWPPMTRVRPTARPSGAPSPARRAGSTPTRTRGARTTTTTRSPSSPRSSGTTASPRRAIWPPTRTSPSPTEPRPNSAPARRRSPCTAPG